MNVAVFSSKPYDERFLSQAGAKNGLKFTFLEPRLTRQTVSLAGDFQAVCCFVNDELDRGVLEQLAASGVRFIALRCAGFNNVDLHALSELGLSAARVPAYSPYAVAEHTVGLILTLNRKIHRAFNRVREMNFALDGLLGFDLNGRTVGVVGTGKIGAVLVKILQGFGCRVLAYDPFPNAACSAEYVALEQLLEESAIVSLHCPLTPETYHLIDAQALAQMQPQAMLINTSRGALVDTPAVVESLKAGHLGALGLDVYEEEGDLFFEDFSGQVVQDDVFARLLTFPNVVITGHQAFFTAQALTNIADTTVMNLLAFARKELSGNELPLPEGAPT